MDTRLALAVETYANLSGQTQQQILAAMAADTDCQTARNVVLLMFAAG